jgi:hypothetical protein
MKTKKMTKKQMIEQLQNLLTNTWIDIECIESDIIDDEFYFNDETIQTCKASRAMALKNKRDLDFIAKRLRQILSEA